MVKCLQCQEPVPEDRRDAFCCGKHKHLYRSGQDPDLCAHCQERPRSESKLYTGYCSIKCQRLHTMQGVWG